MKKGRVLTVLMVVMFVFSIPFMVHAAVPQTINYQGYLTNSSGQSVNETVSIVFSLYDVQTGGAALWTETQSVTVSDGIYSVNLGKVTPVGLPFDTQYYLGVKVGADAEMTPRQPLTSVGYAFTAVKADSVAAGSIIDASISDTASIQVSKVSGLGSLATKSAVASADITDGTIANNDLAAGSFSNITGIGDLSSLTVTGNTNLATTSGNVGIGTTTPSAGKVHISGRSSTSTDVGLAVLDDTMSTTQYNRIKLGRDLSIYNQADLEFYYAGANSTSNYFGVGFYGTSDKLVVQANGNVGIGTTSPSYKLDVDVGSNYGTIARVKSSSTNEAYLDVENADGIGAFGVDQNGNAYIRSLVNQKAIYLYTANGGQLYIQPSGNVGIGTTLPASKLDVLGTLSSTTAAATYTASKTATTITATFGTFTAADVGRFFVWENGTVDRITNYISATQVTAADSATITSQAGYTRTANLFVNSSGNVGIGTTSPGYKLDVNGSLNASSLYISGVQKNTVWDAKEPAISAGTTAQYWRGDKTWQTLPSAAVSSVFGRTGAVTAASGDYTAAMVGLGNVTNESKATMFTNPTFTGNVTMPGTGIWNSSGNVGIGTTAPASKLDVEGGVAIGATYSGTSAAPTNGAIIEGNVGIGTANPAEKVHVVGGDILLDNSRNLRWKSAAGVSSQVMYVGNDNTTLLRGLGGGIKFDPGDGNFALVIGPTGASNVGIGTIAPSGKLSVTPTQYSAGTASQSSTTVTGSGTTFTSAMVGSQLVFANGVSAGTITAFTDATHLTVSTSQTVPLQAYNIAYTGLQVTSTGNVGIGTTSPTYKLVVIGNGDDGISVQDSVRANLRLSKTGTGAQSWVTRVDDNGHFRIIDETNSRYPFEIDDATGNVGIGTTSPSKLLDVNSNSIRVRSSKTPASSSAACDQGEMAWDASYVYVCVATNTWKRSALSSW